MSRRDDRSRLDDTAAAALYQLHAKTLFAYVRSRLASWQDSEDIVVDVFLVALESELFPRLAERAQIAWLRRVTQHKIADFYRTAGRKPSVNIDDVADVLQDHDSPEDAALRGEEYLALRSVVEELSPEQQSILRMRFSEGLRCAQIAARLGKQEGTVRKILSRTLNQLRTLYMKSLREVR